MTRRAAVICPAETDISADWCPADPSVVDLSRLPLAGLRGGLTDTEGMSATDEQCEAAAAHLEGADLHLRPSSSYVCTGESLGKMSSFVSRSECHLMSVSLRALAPRHDGARTRRLWVPTNRSLP